MGLREADAQCDAAAELETEIDTVSLPEGDPVDERVS